MDVVDTVGKALGSIGDTVNQAISSRVASEDGGQRVGGVGQQVGQVLQTLGDKLRETMRARAEQQEDEDDDLEARLIGNPLTRDPNTRAAYEVGPEGSARCMGRGPNDMMTTTAASSMEQAMSRMLGRRRGKRSEDEALGQAPAGPAAQVAQRMRMGRRRGKRSDSHHSSTSNAQGAGGMARSG